MDIITMAVALKKAISQTKDIIASHFVAGTNIEITDNPDGTQTINASGEVSVTDEVARQAISDHEADVNNPHSVTKNQIGLGNVDNTSDADKPISTAAQTALNGKQPTISDLAEIRSNATAGAGAATVVQGIDSTANNYIELKSGQREYLSTTVPTGNIPLGSVGMGFDEGVWTYKSGTKVNEGVPTANLFTGDFSQFDNQGGTGNAYDYFKLTGDYTLTLTCKHNCTAAKNTAFGINASGGTSQGGYTGLIFQNNSYTQGQVLSATTSDNDYQYVYIYGGSTMLDWIMENFDVMLNEGSTPLPYEPYGKQKFPFYANGQPLTDYTIYGNTGGVGDATANEFTGDISQFDNQGGTDGRYDYFKLTGDYTITLTCKDDCTAPTGITFGLDADGGVVTGGFTALVAQRGIYTKGQVITGKTSDNGYQYIYIYESGTEFNWIMEHFDIMLNKGDTVLPYEPYGKYKIPVICGGQTTNIYLDSPLGANDSIDYTTSQTAIPTVDGANSLICNTTVQPSKVSLTYTGWHSDMDDTVARKVMGIAETGNDYIKMGNGITLYISATQPENPSEGDLWIGG